MSGASWVVVDMLLLVTPVVVWGGNNDAGLSGKISAGGLLNDRGWG